MRKTNGSAWLALIALFLPVNLKVQTQSWSFTSNMNYYHAFHTATLLNNVEVLVAGRVGIGNAYQVYAELYNPSSGTFTVTGSLNTGRHTHAAALLPNGEVLIVGGEGSLPPPNGLSTTELYNPATGTFANAERDEG